MNLAGVRTYSPLKVRLQRHSFHKIPFPVNRAIVKTAVVTLGTGDLPSLLPSLKCKAHRKKITINARREFIVHVCLCRHTTKEVCDSSVMSVDSSVRDASTMSWLLVGPATSPVDSGVPDASSMPWLLVGPAVPHLPRDLLNCKIKTLSPRETTLVMKPK
ncbi:hypothetical protein TNCV_732691 [Trichonephila clavipes]|nr:hypothetical protein TNCV_732691 [Trichonephila clavipes]